MDMDIETRELLNRSPRKSRKNQCVDTLEVWIDCQLRYYLISLFSWSEKTLTLLSGVYICTFDFENENQEGCVILSLPFFIS